MRVFIDGVHDETNSAGGLLNNWDNDHFLVLGGSWTGGNHWQGTIKHLAIYDRAMNASQAENVFNGLEPGDGVGDGIAIWDEVD